MIDIGDLFSKESIENEKAVKNMHTLIFWEIVIPKYEIHPHLGKRVEGFEPYNSGVLIY